MMKRLAIITVTLLTSIAAFAQKSEIVYTDASEFPVFGKAVENTSGRYERLPLSLKEVIRPSLWTLGTNSAGLYIRFRSDSPCIYAKWEPVGHTRMPHMTPMGAQGLDIYAYIDGKWRFVGAPYTDWSGSGEGVYENKMVANMDPVMREYMVYLPLYDGLKSLEIGVAKGSVIEKPQIASPSADGPVVMYGTSILQGGCASRPGMAHTAILSRKLGREVINLGFSGNAKLDYEIAEIIAQVKNPSLIVLDYVPNSVAPIINEKGETFFNIVREAHPDVPVIFVEDPLFTNIIVDNSLREEVVSKNAAQKALFLKLKKQGVKNIFYIGAEGMIGDDGDACVDGIHFTDLGMLRYVEHIMPTVKKAMKK